MDVETYLKAIEDAHRRRTGTLREPAFCYWPSQIDGDTYRVSMVERDVEGHFPVIGYIEHGSREACDRRAADLNRLRLGLREEDAALIVSTTFPRHDPKGRRQ